MGHAVILQVTDLPPHTLFCHQPHESKAVLPAALNNLHKSPRGASGGEFPSRSLSALPGRSWGWRVLVRLGSLYGQQV